MKHKLLLLLICIMFEMSNINAQESAQQVLSTNLPQILAISKVYVETVEHERDAPLYGVTIKTNSTVNQNLNIIGLSPMSVKIRTNISTPITISAKFQQFNHVEGKYSFSPSDLWFTPSSYTINNPYNDIITNEFVPTMNVRNITAEGVYEGTVVFTLGAV